MGDEKDILLKVGVDASDVAKGVADVKAGVGEMNDAALDRTVRGVGGESGNIASSAQVSAAMTEQAATTEQAADATDKLAASTEQAAVRGRDFRNILSALQNPLGLLIDVANRGKGAITGMFSAVSLAIMAAFVAMKVLTDAVNEYIEKNKQARKDWEDFQAAQRAAAGGRAAKTEDIAATLAKVGMVGGDELRKGEDFARKAREKGYGEAAIGKVAPLAAGGKMTDEEIQQALAMEEYQPGTVDIKTPKDMAKAPEKLRRLLAKKQTEIAGYQAAAEQRQARLQERASRGEDDAILKLLEQKREQLPADEQKRAELLKDIHAVDETGRIPETGYNWQYGSDRDKFSRRQKEAARMGQMVGLITRKRAEAIAEVTLPGAVFGIGELPSKEPEESPHIAAAQPAPAVAQAGAAGTVVNYVTHNHGPVYTGGSGGGSARVVRAP